MIEPFVRDYERGLTPSPCVGCNARMKIPELIAVADDLGCGFVATGHYARVSRMRDTGRYAVLRALDDRKDQSYMLASLSQEQLAGCGFVATGHYARVSRMRDTGRYAVLRALDDRKDQSYMLASLSQEQLARLILPLGGMTKLEVRSLAYDLALPAADAPESQDICFAPNGYRELLASYGVESKPGVIVNTAGDPVGAHQGLFDFTVGQRKGIGVAGPEPYYVTGKNVAEKPGVIVNTAGDPVGAHQGLFDFTVGQRKGIGVAGPEPYYVTGKNVAENELVIGTAQESLIRSVEVRDANWQAIEEPREPVEAMVKLRYRSDVAENELVIGTAQESLIRSVEVRDANWQAIEEPREPVEAMVKLRYRSVARACIIEPVDAGRLHVTLPSAQPATAPGQFAVFYQGSAVLGGGVIEEVNS